MKNVLFIYPEFRDQTFWSFKDSLRIIKKKANMVPLAPVTIAAMLPADYKINIIDENVRPVTDAAIHDADVVMITAMDAQHDSTMDLVSRCNEAGKPSILGGPHATTCFDQVPGVSSVYIGEAQLGLWKVVRDLEQGRLRKAYGHVVDGYIPAAEKIARINATFQGDTDLITGPHPSLAKSVIPRWDAMDLSEYNKVAWQIGTGCPTKCSFCGVWPQNGLKQRQKDVGRAMAELDFLVEQGFRGGVYIVIDNFIANLPFMENEFLPALTAWQKAHDYPFEFNTEGTISMGDKPELLDAMYTAGITSLFCGIETPSKEALEEANKFKATALGKEAVKGATVDCLDTIVEQSHNIIRHGFSIEAGLIFGFDKEGKDIAKRMVELCERANIPMPMMAFLGALPETELHERLKKEGRLKSMTTGNSLHGIDVNFKTARPEKDVLADYRWSVNNLYAPNLRSYYGRADRMMDMTKKAIHPERRMDYDGFIIFMRTLAHVIPTRYGYESMKFLTKRFLKDPSTIAKAVEFVVKGVHMADIARGTRAVHATRLYLDERLQELRQYASGQQASLSDWYGRKAEAVRAAEKRWRKLDTFSQRKLRERYHTAISELERVIPKIRAAQSYQK